MDGIIYLLIVAACITLFGMFAKILSVPESYTSTFISIWWSLVSLILLVALL